MTVAPESTANRAPSANAFPEVMNESPTLMGSTMQLGQAPTSWDSVLAAPTASSAVPVPWL